MSLLEKIQSMKMPFAELKGVTFIEADKDRVVARMLVRPDLCTLRNTIHGGAVMALADSVGAAATVIRSIPATPIGARSGGSSHLPNPWRPSAAGRADPDTG